MGVDRTCHTCKITTCSQKKMWHRTYNIRTGSEDLIDCYQPSENTSISIELKPTESYLGTSCIICGEIVRLTPQEVTALEYGHHINSKVCDKCKQAVLYIRDQIK